ncbi:hypothetical protein MH928_02765 [Flavobacterium sp. WW92]|uniref:hypothetical protein n=1 Tax=unclassified Flavobacterium TaxID=196869 RepID=UPI00222536F9|nr:MULTISPECIES: hypothetical protein [unclassified Flavobacterium]WDO13632.1 hypothetical protein MH928_02765 [Flavobacterium sp. WW92]
MEARTLRRPANWQTFEELCKKLCGEIWEYPEIQMNGRLGQDQSGVDIFGIPKGESEYFGIQCKGKSEYNDNHPQFTEKEILAEIEKAKSFEPPLKKFYLATTALNDAKLQSFIRKKNLENLNSGLFEIHLFCWESIVNLIDENQHTHDWYVKNKKYKTNQSVSVTFGDGSTNLNITVPFRQKIEIFRKKLKTANITDSILAHSRLFAGFNIPKTSLFGGVNHSYARFNLKITNTGIDPIEGYKLRLNFEGEYHEMSRAIYGHFLLPNVNVEYDTYLDTEKNTGTIIPANNVLVSDDVMNFDTINLKPYYDRETKLIIKWKLLSKDFKDEGELELTVIPEIKRTETTTLVYEDSEVRIIESEIEDYITNGDDDE